MKSAVIHACALIVFTIDQSGLFIFRSLCLQAQRSAVQSLSEIEQQLIGLPLRQRSEERRCMGKYRMSLVLHRSASPDRGKSGRTSESRDPARGIDYRENYLPSRRIYSAISEHPRRAPSPPRRPIFSSPYFLSLSRATILTLSVCR